MKKWISFTLGLCLIVLTTISLAGCNLLEMFSTSDYEYDEAKVQASIETMTQSGYKITVRYINTGTGDDGPQIESSGFTIAADGDLWYCKQDNKTLIIDFTDDVEYVMYEKVGNAELWTKTTTAYVDMGSKETLKALYSDTYIATFTNYGVIAAGLRDKGEVTVAGRTCTKYEAAASVMGYSYTNEYYIDNETGLCLKNIMAVGSTTDGSGVTSYECTEFVLSYTITVPAENECVSGVQE